MTKETLSALIEGRQSLRQIAAATGKSSTTVRYWLKVHGLSTVADNGRPKAYRDVSVKDTLKSETCLNCDKPLTYYNKKYCTNKCQTQHAYQTVTLVKFQQGLIYKPETLCNILSVENGAECVKCGCGDTWMGMKLSLQVDHIDGNRDNNFPTNLRLLCPNCHTQTPTWGNKKREFSE